MADYLDKIAERKRLLSSYRGRRYLVCNAIDEIRAVIDYLGIEEDPKSIPPESGLPPMPNDQVKREMKNLTNSLLRLIIAHNDGHISDEQLRSF